MDRGSYPSKPPFVFKKISQRLTDVFHQESFESMRGEKSKLRTYALFKKQTGLEPYLSEISNTLIRNCVTRFRLSNHKLMIEVGRHQGLENREERVCPFCPQSIEDEAHFLLSCPVYRFQRQKFLDPITTKSREFLQLSEGQKIELLMCKMDQNVCQFIFNSMEIREFLVNSPKRHM